MKQLLHKHNIEIINPNRSLAEVELFEYCQNLFPNKLWENNTRDILPGGYELDIVCRELKFAIEYAGLYWHSFEINPNKKYHQWKYLEMQRLGYKLITVFESDDIIKSQKYHFPINLE